MSRSDACRQETGAGLSGPFHAIRQLMRKLAARSSRGRRKRLKPGDLSPQLLRDVGLTDAAASADSLEEKWRLEMKLQSK